MHDSTPAMSVVRRVAMQAAFSLSLSKMRFSAHCCQATNFCLKLQLLKVACRAFAAFCPAQKGTALACKAAKAI